MDKHLNTETLPSVQQSDNFPQQQREGFVHFARSIDTIVSYIQENVQQDEETIVAYALSFLSYLPDNKTGDEYRNQFEKKVRRFYNQCKNSTELEKFYNDGSFSIYDLYHYLMNGHPFSRVWKNSDIVFSGAYTIEFSGPDCIIYFADLNDYCQAFLHSKIDPLAFDGDSNKHDYTLREADSNGFSYRNYMLETPNLIGVDTSSQGSIDGFVRHEKMHGLLSSNSQLCEEILAYILQGYSVHEIITAFYKQGSIYKKIITESNYSKETIIQLVAVALSVHSHDPQGGLYILFMKPFEEWKRVEKRLCGGSLLSEKIMTEYKLGENFSLDEEF